MIDSMESKNFVINQQNKQINFLYKQEENYVTELNELRENKEAVYKMIADLRDYIYETDILEKEYMLEKLQDMQMLCK